MHFPHFPSFSFVFLKRKNRNIFINYSIGIFRALSKMWINQNFKIIYNLNFTKKCKTLSTNNNNHFIQLMKNKNEESRTLRSTSWTAASWCISLNVPLSTIIVLLGLRNKQIADDYVPSTDPVAMFVDYFGKIEPDTT